MIFRRTNLAAIAALLFAGCEHPIKIAPDIGTVVRMSDAPRISLNVGYYIPSEMKAVEITSLGGGGNSVRYFPYRNIEPGFQKMLSNEFHRIAFHR